jgi:hypothetical protein
MGNKGIIQKVRRIPDANIEAQFHNIIQGLNLFPSRGVLSTDPDTTGWGAADICIWVNNSTATAVKIKIWDGSAIKTITMT